MKTKGILLILGCLALLSSECNNTDTSSTTEVETNAEENKAKMEQLLINGDGWSIIKSEVSPDIMGRTDIFSDLDACDKDDIEYYKEGGIAVYDEGPLKCSPDAEQTVADRWILEADSALIIYTDNVLNGDTFYILSLSEHELVSTYKHQIQGTVYTFIDTYIPHKKRNP